MNQSKNLQDELNENTNRMKEQRKLHLKNSYHDLQDHVVNKLKKYSCQYYKNECKITIGNLYIKNYYDHVNIEYTNLGYIFANGLNPKLSFPSSDELEYLTTKLEKYLILQGLDVTYTSHCCITISW